MALRLVMIIVVSFLVNRRSCFLFPVIYHVFSVSYTMQRYSAGRIPQVCLNSPKYQRQSLLSVADAMISMKYKREILRRLKRFFHCPKVQRSRIYPCKSISVSNPISSFF